MKPALQKSAISADHSFEISYLRAPFFDPNWHFHCEYQLFTVLKGTGTRFVGDHVSPFKPGDLVFTGPNLPHLWQSDAAYFKGDKNVGIEGIVIYLPEDFLGNHFLAKKEMYKIRQLFLKAQRGMEIVGTAAEEVKAQMLKLYEATDFDSILVLLGLLNYLANMSSYQLLATTGYSNSLKEADTERMSRVHSYVMQNFREKITLEHVAAIANMTPPSFSRYFSKHANKTFSNFLTEIRIGNACKLLMEEQLEVSQICFDSGFNTLSNFNRQFKVVTKYNPLAYQRKYGNVQRVKSEK
ncbi:MAG TPA: AraC family transcriptional regulator [Chryseolinea sp.]|nr:AraC family transcriptional regulator [Chryseolinea sp.]